MAEFNANEIKAPVYRYFTVDLMTNKVLMEIPFQKVSYERALKAAGGFSGEIPVIEKTKNLSLYENTMPGQTGLYVVRNGKAVWGGIIWSRDYDVKSQMLSVDASEFTSYFHHRLIWKTLNFQFGATVSVSDPNAPSTTVYVNGATNPNAFNNLLGWNLTSSTVGTGSAVNFVSATTSDSTVPSYSANTGKAGYVRLTYGTGASAYGGIAYADAINPGGQYNVSLYARQSSSTANKLQLRISWLDDTYTQVGSYSYAALGTLTTAWQQYYMTGLVAPAGATLVNLEIYPGAQGTAMANNVNLYATAVRLAPTTDLTDYAYFSGDSVDKSATDYYTWDGETNASVSYRTVVSTAAVAGTSTTTVTIDNGDAREVTVGATVGLDFYDPEDFHYNGNYEVTRRDSPSSSTFEINSAVVADITEISFDGSRTGGASTVLYLYFKTAAPHGFSSGDTVTLNFTGSDSRYNGSYTVTLDYSGDYTTMFRVNWLRTAYVSSNGVPGLYQGVAFGWRSTQGTASRYLPAGVNFENVTLTVHTDTYDYIRGLVKNVWNDFVDVKLADEYLTPGINRELTIKATQLGGGYATITTTSEHGLTIGQSVVIANVNSTFNGTWVVESIPSDTTFTFKSGGFQAYTPLTIFERAISARSLNKGVAKLYYDQITYNTPISPGDKITISPNEDYDGYASAFVGDHIVDSVDPNGNITFSSDMTTAISSPHRMIRPYAYKVVETPSSAASGMTKNTYFSNYEYGTVDGYSLTNGILTCHFASPLVQNSGDLYNRYPVVGDRANVSLPFSRTIVEKSIDAPNKTKALTTDVPHNLSVGDSLWVFGDTDSYNITQMSTGAREITLTTSRPHNIQKNQRVNITGLTEEYSNVAFQGITKQDYKDANNTVVATFYYAKIQVNGGKHNLLYPGWDKGTGGVVNNVGYNFSNFYSYFPVSRLTVKSGTATVSTSQPHTFLTNDTITLSGLSETANIISAELQDGIGILTTDKPHNFQTSDQITVTGVGAPYDTKTGVNYVVLSTTDTRILYQVDAQTIKNYITVQNKNGKKLAPTTNTIAPTKVSGKIQTKNSTFNGSFTVSSINGNSSVSFTIDANDTDRTYSASQGVKVGGESILRYGNVAAGTTTYAGYSYLNYSSMNADRSLNIPLNLPTGTTLSPISGPISLVRSADTKVQAPILTNTSVGNMSNALVTRVTSNTFTYAPTLYSGNYTGLDDVRPALSKLVAISTPTGAGQVSSPSSVNGYFPVTRVVSDYRVETQYDWRGAGTGPKQNVLETTTNSGAFFRMMPDYWLSDDPDFKSPGGTTYPSGTVMKSLTSAVGIDNNGGSLGFGGSFTAKNSSGVYQTTLINATTATVVGYDFSQNTISFQLDRAKKFGSTTYRKYTTALGFTDSYDSSSASANNAKEVFTRSGGKFHADIPYTPVVPVLPSYKKVPTLYAPTYGSFPGNSNLGMKFSTSQYSGVNVTPTAYRGYALTNVGDALDSYSGTTNGFEYRIDVDYDADSDTFSRTFVLIPINFPDPPNAGEVSDPSRFGADQLVFEYPGSVTDVKLKESAENSATRFFAVGDADLGADAADPFSAASNLDLLDANSDRRWPLLDAKESISDVSDKDILYTYAEQYLNEAQPPAAEFTISVNGTLDPPLETYLPGKWCSIIVKDDFIQDRLASKLEPRDTVLVRKIDSYKVSVPDGVTFPETVDITLVAEWDVDKKATE